MNNRLKEIADQADMIINGYAFTKNREWIRVLNLNCPTHASVIDNDGKIIETSMDDIENTIVLDYYEKNRKFLEE